MTETRLSDFISTNIDAILDQWDEFAKDTHSARHMDVATIRDHAEGMLRAIAEDLRQEQTPEEQAEKSKGRGRRSAQESAAELHGTARGQAEFSIVEEVSEFRALRASVLRLWSAANANAESPGGDELTRFNEALDQALAESVARFAAEKDRHARLIDALLSASSDLNYILDVDGRFVYANNALSSLYALPLSDMIGKNFADLGPSVAAEFQQRLKHVIETKEAYRGEMPCALATGGIYDYILAPVIGAEGNVEAIAGMARDMTDRKKLEDDLRREKAIAETIIESAPGGFFMIDQQAKLVRWNKYWVNELGLSNEQLLGSSILSTIDERDREIAGAKFLAAFATGYARMEIRVPLPRRGARVFMTTARRFMIEETPYVAGFFVDITDRKQSEDALAAEKLFFDALIESAPGAFYVIDMEGNYFRWNNNLKKLTGLDDRELWQRPLLLSIQEEDRPLAAATMQRAFETGYAEAELHLPTHDRGVRLFLMTARRFQAANASYLVGVGTDTTEWISQMKALEREAWTDPLTRVANRGHFLEMAQQEFARCRRYGHPVSVWMLDIDYFKVVNDTYGHHAGDVALQSVVSTSQHVLRDWDILGRMGGEEFAVLLPETEAEQAVLVAERLRNIFATSRIPLDEGASTRITVSIGIATAHDDDDLERLLKRADLALYAAKRTGRDKVCTDEHLPAL